MTPEDIAEMQRHEAEVDKAFRKLERQRADLTAKNIQLRADVAKLIAERDQLRQQLEAEATAYYLMADERDKARDERDKARDERDASRIYRDAFRTQRNEARRERDEALAALEEGRAAYDRRRADLAATEAMLVEARASLELMTAERDSWRTQLDTDWQAEQISDLMAAAGRAREERDEARAALDRARALANKLASLAPEDDWGDDMPSTVGADVGRQFLATLDGSGT